MYRLGDDQRLVDYVTHINVACGFHASGPSVMWRTAREAKKKCVKKCADHPLIGEIRGFGLIAGVELVADRGSRRPFESVGIAGSAFFRHAQALSLLVRAIGDTVALSPPLIIRPGQVKQLVERFKLALEDTHEVVQRHAPRAPSNDASSIRTRFERGATLSEVRMSG